MVKCFFWVDLGVTALPRTPRYDGRVRVNPKETLQPTTKTHLVRFGVFVRCGVSLGLTRTPGCRVTTLLVRFYEQSFTITYYHFGAIKTQAAKRKTQAASRCHRLRRHPPPTTTTTDDGTKDKEEYRTNATTGGSAATTTTMQILWYGCGCCGCGGGCMVPERSQRYKQYFIIIQSKR